MDLNQLRERGGFAPAAPVVREVSWTHPDESGVAVTDTFTVHVVKLSAGAADRLRDEAAKDPTVPFWARLVSASLRLGDDASEVLSIEQVLALVPDLAQSLVDAVLSVNGRGTSAKN